MGQLKLFDLPAIEVTDDLPELSRLIALALLHRNPSKYAVIDKAIAQAREKGVSYVLCNVSNEARKFMKLARAVGAEKYRATAFMRLQPIDQHRVLYGEFAIEHQTAELIMLHFMKRFPRYNIMIVFNGEVYIGRNKEIFQQALGQKKVTLPKAPDDFERYWLAFYRSQYIPERRNIKYLKRMIPQKYWRWVTELQEFDQEIRGGGDRGGGRNSNDPGPGDPSGHVPLDRAEALDRPDPHDRAGDRVGGTDRDTHGRGDKEHDSRPGLSTKAINRF
jgi:probable DNA metabolism protein